MAINIKFNRKLRTIWTPPLILYILLLSGPKNLLRTLSEKQPAVFVLVHVNSLALKIELDTGSNHSLFGSGVWEHLGKPSLHGGPNLMAYGVYTLPVLGITSVFVLFKGALLQLELVVVRKDTTALLGRLWMAAFTEH